MGIFPVRFKFLKIRVLTGVGSQNLQRAFEAQRMRISLRPTVRPEVAEGGTDNLFSNLAMYREREREKRRWR